MNQAVREALAAAEAAERESDPTVGEATDGSLASQLRAEYLRILEDEKALAERKSTIRGILIGLAPDGVETVTVDNIPVYSVKVETRTGLATDVIREKYPEHRYPQFYVTSETKVLRMEKPVTERQSRRRSRGA